jgi:hypothetical protein
MAMDTVALRQVTAIYRGEPKGALACMAGHFRGPVPVLDSVTSLQSDCPAHTFAMLGFAYEAPDPQQIVAQLMRILNARRDVMLAAVVHGIVPIVLPDGSQAHAPVILAVWRTPSLPPSRPGDGP